MTITEKVSYLKGLIEGLKLDTETKEGKIISAMADILEDMALSISDVEDEIESINEYMEAIDDDLCTVEDELFGDECECGCGDDDCCCCGDDDEDEYYEIVCPNCQEKIMLDESIDPSNIKCPSCNKEFSAE